MDIIVFVFVDVNLCIMNYLFVINQPIIYANVLIQLFLVDPSKTVVVNNYEL